MFQSLDICSIRLTGIIKELHGVQALASGIYEPNNQKDHMHVHVNMLH